MVGPRIPSVDLGVVDSDRMRKADIRAMLPLDAPDVGSLGRRQRPVMTAEAFARLRVDGFLQLRSKGRRMGPADDLSMRIRSEAVQAFSVALDAKGPAAFSGPQAGRARGGRSGLIPSSGGPARGKMAGPASHFAAEQREDRGQAFAWGEAGRMGEDVGAGMAGQAERVPFAGQEGRILQSDMAEIALPGEVMALGLRPAEEESREDGEHGQGRARPNPPLKIRVRQESPRSAGGKPRGPRVARRPSRPPGFRPPSEALSAAGGRRTAR
jgi:hypothetical protein